MQLSARRIAQAAAKDVDALRRLPELRRFEGRRGRFSVEYVHAKNVTAQQLDEAFVLTKKNMQAAFMHLRFLVEEGRPVTYVYEIQVASEFQGQGIGAHLMKIADGIGSGYGLSETMLTVFNRNAGALQFYKSLGYSVDPTSPEWEPDEWEDGYTIMRKKNTPSTDGNGQVEAVPEKSVED